MEGRHDGKAKGAPAGAGAMGEKQKYPTMGELEPSHAAVRTEDGRGGRRRSSYAFAWEGMNSRDETDPVSRKPVGRMIREGFDLVFDGDPEDGD
jgi:hypothetical protein